MASWINNEVTIHPMTFTFCFANKFLKNYVHAAIFLCMFGLLTNFCTPTFSNNNLLLNKYAFTILVACSRIPCMSRDPACGRHVYSYIGTQKHHFVYIFAIVHVIDKSDWEQMSDWRDTHVSFSIWRCVQRTKKDKGTIWMIDFRGREPWNS